MVEIKIVAHTGGAQRAKKSALKDTREKDWRTRAARSWFI